MQKNAFYPKSQQLADRHDDDALGFGTFKAFCYINKIKLLPYTLLTKVSLTTLRYREK